LSRESALALCEAEETAAAIRCYGSTDIPHVLRTEAYARQRWAWARQHSIWHPAADAAEELLSRRQAAPHRTPRAHRSFGVREGAIMALGNTERDLDVAIDQLRHLLALTNDLARCVRILHWGTRLPTQPGPASTIVTDRAGRETVFANSLAPNDYMPVRDDHRIGDFTRLFTEVTDHCFDQARIRARITSAIRRCRALLATAPPAGEHQVAARPASVRGHDGRSQGAAPADQRCAPGEVRPAPKAG